MHLELAEEQLDELTTITTHDEDGRHFTQFSKHWEDLEEYGLIRVHRPAHESQEHYTLELTDAGRTVVDDWTGG